MQEVVDYNLQVEELYEKMKRGAMGIESANNPGYVEHNPPGKLLTNVEWSID